MTIRMQPDLARRAKAYARKRQQTFTQIVEEAVARLLDADSASALKLPPMPVVRGKTQISERELRRVVEALEVEDDRKRLGMNDALSL